MYDYLTLAQAKTQLGQRLGDPNGVFWKDSEKGLYIQESLRTWGAAAGYWREAETFSTAANTAFYALEAKLPNLLGFTITDQDVITLIQYHLLEAVNNWGASGAWGGTDMFTMDDVSNALQRRRDQFLVETGCVLSYNQQPITITGRQELPNSVIDVRRAAFKDTLGKYTTLFRADEFQYTSFNPAWLTDQDTPNSYSVAATRPVELQLAPTPIGSGSLDLITVSSGPPLNPSSGATVLGIPDNFAWVVKWGALADLFANNSQGTDPERQAFCEQRWQIGCEIARKMPVVITAQIQGVPLLPDSLFALDAALPNWQNNTGTPSDVGIAGRNILGLSNVPRGTYSVTLDVVRNAPVPTDDADFIQVGREELGIILDHAQVLAGFKMGGAEFADMLSLDENFMRMALIYAERLGAQASYAEVLLRQSEKEDIDRPRRRGKTTKEVVRRPRFIGA